MSTKHMKRYWNFSSFTKWKLKQLDTTKHSLKWLKKKKKLKIPTVVKNVKHLEFTHMADGNTKWDSHFGKHFGRVSKR